MLTAHKAETTTATHVYYKNRLPNPSPPPNFRMDNVPTINILKFWKMIWKQAVDRRHIKFKQIKPKYYRPLEFENIQARQRVCSSN